MNTIFFLQCLSFFPYLITLKGEIIRGKEFDLGFMDERFLYGRKQCARLCGWTTACLSYGHYKQLFRCMLYSVDSSISGLIDDNNFVLEDKSSIPSNILGSCANINCASNERCVIGRLSTHCAIVVCDVPPDDVANSNYTLVKTVYNVQENVTYTCQNGYTMSGDPQVTCKPDGTWSQPTFNCNACPSPPNISNAQIESGEVTIGATRTYTCSLGYTSGGNDITIICQDNITWSTPNASCSLADCGTPPVLSGGSVDSNPLTTYQTSRTYTCDPGYTPDTGTSSITCQANGFWSTPGLTCSPVDCGEPTLPSHASVDPACTTYNCNKTVSCGSGYTLSVPGTILTCQSSGLWTSPSYTCVVSCSDPPYKTYTTVTGTGTSEGSSRTYQCGAGAILVSGSVSVTIYCESNGNWQTPNIECTKCSSYTTTYTQRTDWFFNPPVSFTPSISGGSVNPSYCANACNTRQDFFCVAYYYRKSTGGYCVLRPMRVHDNTNHIQYDNANTDYDEYIRDCAPPVDCSDPPYKTYTSVTGTGTTEGSTRTYQCDAGAILVSGTDPVTITCESSGNWQTPNIECTKCSSYADTYIHRTDWFFNPPVSFTPSISGGSVNPSYCANACNTRQDFFCVAYYYRKSTGGYCVLRPMRVHDDTNHIQYNNANTDYDEYIRDCAPPVDCSDPPYKTYTSVTGTGTTEGSTRTYQCDAGAILVSGTDPVTITCESSGNWQTPNIECTQCSSYATTYTQRTDWFFNPPVSFTPSISGGSVNPSYCANACNTRQDFFCVAYYYRKSTGGYCVLRPMRVHDDTNHIQYNNANTDYDEYIRDCAPPVDCSDPPYKTYTSVTGSGTTEGSTRTYQCDTGATLVSGTDPVTITCESTGSWQTPNIECAKCSSYADTYTQRTDWFFNPPVSFTPSISGGSVNPSYCANACNTRQDFFCVAYYYRKSTGGYCVLRPMRVHDDTNHIQYNNANTDYDEYIRNCN